MALHKGFYDTLPQLKEVSPDEADIVWLIYDLVLEQDTQLYQLRLYRQVYTMFEPALSQITTPEPGSITEFLDVLQDKLDEKLDGGQNPPDAPALKDLL